MLGQIAQVCGQVSKQEVGGDKLKCESTVEEARRRLSPASLGARRHISDRVTASKVLGLGHC
jgi:hypothetical protein